MRIAVDVSDVVECVKQPGDNDEYLFVIGGASAKSLATAVEQARQKGDAAGDQKP